MSDGFSKFVSSNPWFTMAIIAAVAYILKELREDHKKQQEIKGVREKRLTTSLVNASRSIDKLTWQIEGLDKTLIEMKVDVTKNTKDLNALHSKVRIVETDIKNLKDA